MKATGTASAAERDRILSDNLQLHRMTARVYDTVHPHMRNSFEQRLQTKDIRRMVHAFAAEAPRRVLDLGCGTGNLTVQFLEEGATVDGVDMSAEMLDVLRSKLERVPAWRGRYRVHQRDIEGFLASNAGEFEIVSMSSVAHHLADYLETLEALAQRITPGGFLYLVHEPAHRTEMTRSSFALRRVWSIIPRGLDRLLRHTRMDSTLHREWEAQDTTFADFHYHRDGISMSAISQRLMPHGFGLAEASRYNAHETSLVSWLDNHWCSRFRYEQFQRTYFRAIWRRV
ncbi:MAG: hypothetical protein DMF84_08020 [Acidobacteria bacterium]|nr:MAG: hypothetical protein DMF84_08020 [Acidobacteriota bacterium]